MKFLDQIAVGLRPGAQKLSALLLLSLSLAGCGGGGGSPAPAVTPPIISASPVAANVVEGQTATFSVTAVGSSPLGYQWQQSMNSGATWSNALGTTTSLSYTTALTTLANNGILYRVVVSNSAGSVTSDSALLSVSAVQPVPVIGTQPSAATVTAGQTATFTVAANSILPLTYQWQKSVDSGTIWSSAPGTATLSNYTTAPTTLPDDNGVLYRVVVSNSGGSVTSDSALLTVAGAPTPPVIGTQPSATTVTVGQTATFTVGTSGTLPLIYQWKQSADGGANWSNASGTATTSSYSKSATTPSDNGSLYRVVVTNTAGSATSDAALLTVNSATPNSTERQVNATATDGLITAQPSVEAPHVVINPSPAVTASGKLLVFLPGTQGVPTQYRYLLRAGANRGFHAVGLNYVNRQAMGGLCQGSSDPDCFWNARRVVIFGGLPPVSNQTPVATADSIFNRLYKLLGYMHSNYPSEGWGQFIKSDSTVNWSKVILAGHSQGGGHVGVLAKTVLLSRAVYFSSPEDWRGFFGPGSPANWSAKTNVTPASRQYGFGADLDTFVPNSHAIAHWDNLQLSKPNSGPVLVDNSSAPFGNSHQLHTALNFNPASQAGSDNLSQHGITVLDTATPLDGSGKPLFDSIGVWAYLCFE